MKNPRASAPDANTRASSQRRLTALGFSALLASGMAVGLAGFRAPPAGGARLDGDAIVESDRFFSDIDFERGADRRWQFPRLRAAQLLEGESLIFSLPGARAIEIPLVERRFVAADTVGFVFHDAEIGATAEITLRRGRIDGTVLATFDGRSERWRLRTVDLADGTSDDWYEPVADDGDDRGMQPLDPSSLIDRAAADGGVAGACVDNGEFVDLLLVYTPEFAALFTDVSALETALAADVTRANAALVNSRALPRLRVAEIVGTPSNSTGTLATDLDLVTGLADGWADEVHTVRDAVKADLVVLYSASGGPGVVSWLLPSNAPIDGAPAFGFSAVNAAGGFALAQGVGFNFGCCSAFGDSTACNLGGFQPFSMAWRFTAGGNNAAYRTVMASGGAGTQLPNFSNPSVFFLGVATGANGSDPATSAHNARTIGLTAYTVANYRCGNSNDTDCDGDGLSDADAIANGSVPDCNLTGFPDSCDIASGISLDANADGIPDDCPLQDVELFPGGIAVLDTFGSAVATAAKSGGPEIFTLIGAPGDDSTVTNSGAAYIVTTSAGAVVSADVLRATAPVQNALFGRGLALFSRPSSVTPNYAARDLAIIGAYRESPTSALNSKGAVYQFARQPDGTWTQTWRYTAPASGGLSAGAGSLFGYSVALGRNPVETREIVMIGAPGRNEGRGAVYQIQNYLSGGNEIGGLPQLRTLQNGIAGDAFGSALALEPIVPTTAASRVAMVVGAPGRLENLGGAFVYDRAAVTSNSGVQPFPTTPFTLSASGAGAPPVAGDRFGAAVAIRSNIIVVGAPGYNEGRGRIHVWERNPNPTPVFWAYRGNFTPADAKPGDAFGSSVAISASTTPGEFVVIAGAPKADILADLGTRTDSGRVYILRKLPGVNGLELLGTRTNFNPASGDEFGFSAASTRGLGVVGAPFTDQSGLNSGRARLIPTP